VTDSETTAAMRKIAGLLSHRPTIAVLHGQPVILTTLFLPQVEVIPPPESPEEVACFGPRRVDP
jgi:hypothetical protein